MDDYLKIKIWLYIFIAGLFLSGITAFPLEWQMGLLHDYVGIGSPLKDYFPNLSEWITKIYFALHNTYSQYPFIAYGTDWLGFAHIILGILFIGPLRDPIKNIWVIEFGIICCILVIPFAAIFGEIRGIPIFWRLVDSSFGAIGIIPLMIVYKKVKSLPNALMANPH